jgi:riboflavin transporter FmnP
MNDQNLGSRDNVSNKTKVLVKAALLTIIAVVLQALEFLIPFLPFVPPFLKFELSDIPAILGAFALGPAAGVSIELVKNIIHFVLGLNPTGGVGELANFLIGSAMVIPAGLIYMKHKSKKSALIGMLAGIVCMVIVGAVFNYYVLLPFYGKVMPIQAIIDMSAAANPLIVDMKTLVLYGVIPFNLIKGILISIVTLLIYKRISPILHK